MRLGVNIDHIATIREARRINEPDPLESLAYLKNAGAHQVTLHLREDRRHIHDHDVRRIIESSTLPVNVESSLHTEILDTLCALKPQSITLVPEKREEVTTEGGLNLFFDSLRLQKAIEKIKKSDIIPALFIDPTLENIAESQKMGAEKIELHTGRYANIALMLESNLARTPHALKEFEGSRKNLQSLLNTELTTIEQVAKEASLRGLFVACGHGLNLYNLAPIIKIASVKELNIGHSIISRAVFVGLERAVGEILQKIATLRNEC